MSISVALCTYNGERFLHQQLDSILQQKLTVQEIIICDDGSTDNTIFIIDEYRRTYPIIQLHRNGQRLGAIKNFEKCIALCSGNIIFLSDQDDIWLPHKTQIMVNAFIANNTMQLLFSDAILIDDNDIAIGNTLWEAWKFTPQLQEEWKDSKKVFACLAEGDNKITGATLAFRKELKQYMFPFNLPKHYYHDNWLGLLAAGMNGLVFTGEQLTKYRIHTQQQVGVGNGLARKAEDNKKYIGPDEFKRKVYKLFPEHRPGMDKRLKQTIQQVKALIKHRITP